MLRSAGDNLRVFMHGVLPIFGILWGILPLCKCLTALAQSLLTVDHRGVVMGLSIKEMAMLIGGVLILLDRGSSWLFILGIGLLAVGATRLARNI